MSDEFSLETVALESWEFAGENLEGRFRPLPYRRPGGGPGVPRGRRPFPGRRFGLPRPYGVAVLPWADPTPPESADSADSERTRWLQDCLNQAVVANLPVTGVMGPETRSALRRFQRQQGLRATGSAGPDTVEALRRACAGQDGGVPAVGGTDPEAEIGPLNVTLDWIGPSGAPRLFRKEDVDAALGGGVYIVVDTRGTAQKVGKTENFHVRFKKYKNPDWRYYLANIRNFADKAAQIERAIARLLYRAGETLPAHGEPYLKQPVRGHVTIRNILPGPLRDRLTKAYLGEGVGRERDAKNNPIPQHRAFRPGTPKQAPKPSPNLALHPKNFPEWESASEAAPAGPGGHGTGCACPGCRNCRPGLLPFTEAEEIALAEELLSIASEEELDLFLGKMFKGIGRGLAKFGRFVGRNVLKPLGGALKAIAKSALPFVGGALGSLIPIPGVGTALGKAVVGAVAKALEAEFAGLSPELRDFEAARRFVRLAGTAAQLAAEAEFGASEAEVLEMALTEAARRHLPALAANPAPAAATGSRSGRWVRRGGRILVLGA